MKNNKIWLLLAFVLTLSAVFLVSPVHASIDGGYVGTGQPTVGAGTTCLSCHDTDGPSVYNKESFLETGHPWKYKHTGGAAPTDPLSGLFPTIKGADIDTLTLGEDCDDGLVVCDGSLNLDWSAINYTVGGFGWKIRWGIKDFGQVPTGPTPNPAGDQTGYLWTSTVSSPTGAQYNIENGSWSAYNGNKDKKYECAICHNTNGIVSTSGYACVTDGGTNAAPARTEPWLSNPGMGPEAATRGGYYSSWTFNGVQCEACHGPGEGHGEAGTISVLETAPGIEICAKCHIRAENANGQSAECGGDSLASARTNGAKSAADYLGHHEQYNELVGLNGDGAHASLTCTTCHDPHKRVASVTGAVETALGIAAGTGSQPAAGAIKNACTDCHYGKTSTKAAGGLYTVESHAGLTCVDCHMGEATKSATASTGALGWGRKGDVKTHIFAIDPAGTSTINRNNGIEDNAAAGGNDNGVCEAGETCFMVAKNALPVNYACGKCHDLGTAVDLSLADAQTAATNYHAAIASVDSGYVGSNVCATCHSAYYDDFAQTGHPYKFRHTGGANPPTDALSTLLVGVTPLGVDVDTSSYGEDCGDGLVVCDGSLRLDWDAINYVIGGYGWKARWGIRDYGQNPATNPAGDQTGYVWTGTTQFNMLAADPTLDPLGLRPNYSGYNAGSNKKYECSTCHSTNGRILTTGYDCVQATTYVAGVNEPQPWASNAGMEPVANRGGYYSEWSLDGVQCEACHGAGLNHATAASASNITVNTSKSLCGACHMRAENTNKSGTVNNAECGGPNAGTYIAAYLANGAKTASDFINHHEQYNELVGLNDGVHKDLDCVTCHDPHMRSHKVTDAIAGVLGITDNDQSGEDRGAVVSCESCHGTGTPLAAAGGADTKIAFTKHLPGPVCIDCHMAEVTKSATSESGTWGKMGDVKTHIFKIDPAATSITRPNYEPTPVTVAKNAITVAYACGKCHDSALGTYVGKTLTLAQAQTMATGMHEPAGVTCAVAFSTSVTPNTLTVNVDATVSGDGCTGLTYDWNWGDGEPNGSGDPATHTYATAGSKTITLTASNADGEVGTVTRSVTLTAVNLAPTASATCAFNANTWTYDVTDTSTDDGPDDNADIDADPTLTISVDWGDGSAKSYGSDGGAFSHVYNKVGIFPVTVKAVDNILKTSSYTCVPNATTVAFSISGTVIKSVAKGGGPLYATVQLLNSSNVVIKSVSSSAVTGAFSFNNLKPGTYKIKAKKTGYTFPAATTIVVGPSSSGNTIQALTP